VVGENPASFSSGKNRKSEHVKDPPLRAPLALGGWGGEGYFASMKAGLFCVCESRLSQRSPFFSDRQAVSCVLRVTLMSHCTTRATTMFRFSSL
jgi:hypothetical protein